MYCKQVFKCGKHSKGQITKNTDEIAFLHFYSKQKDTFAPRDNCNKRKYQNKSARYFFGWQSFVRLQQNLWQQHFTVNLKLGISTLFLTVPKWQNSPNKSVDLFVSCLASQVRIPKTISALFFSLYNWIVIPSSSALRTLQVPWRSKKLYPAVPTEIESIHTYRQDKFI